MPRSYRHIQEYEKEIIELKHNGYTGREICEKFGFSKQNSRMPRKMWEDLWLSQSTYMA